MDMPLTPCLTHSPALGLHGCRPCALSFWLASTCAHRKEVSRKGPWSTADIFWAPELCCVKAAGPDCPTCSPLAPTLCSRWCGDPAEAPGTGPVPL